jgi:hypothetical protein
LSSALSIGVAKKQAVVSIMDAVGFKLPWNWLQLASTTPIEFDWFRMVRVRHFLHTCPPKSKIPAPESRGTISS